jgi:hypothetical protein
MPGQLPRDGGRLAAERFRDPAHRLTQVQQIHDLESFTPFKRGGPLSFGGIEPWVLEVGGLRKMGPGGAVHTLALYHRLRIE